MEENQAYKSDLQPKSKIKKRILENNDIIQVYCRFRPIDGKQSMPKFYSLTQKTISINAPDQFIKKHGGCNKYFFKRVFDQDTS